jgi:hypothetical protein
MSLPNSIKQRLGHHRAFVFASELRWAIADCVKNLDRKYKERAVVSLKTEGTQHGTVLLSYMIEPFLQLNEAFSTAHTRYWESLQMARTFLELGYNVDTISWRNDKFQPARKYDAVVDVRHNMQRWSPALPPETVRIFHIDIAHVLFHNAAEANRLLALQQRRGVTLRPRRFEWPNLGIEHADYGTVLGNSFTLGTYEYAQRPLFRLPIPSAFEHPWLEEKIWEEWRRHFLFFSSGGLVHKGLDLALEVFAGMPDCHLTICGPLEQEPDFRTAYRRELFDQTNMHTLGWMVLG